MSPTELIHQQVTHAVTEILAGADLRTVAETTGISDTTLHSAVELYHHAGQHALHSARTVDNWIQFHIEPSRWSLAHHDFAAHLQPMLDTLERAGDIRRWWYIRKWPHWRLRIDVVAPQRRTDIATNLQTHLAHLRRNAGCVAQWALTTYEPEHLVFGGNAGMDVVHRFLAADSEYAIRYLTSTAPMGPIETSTLMCMALFRGAGLDYYETADVWDRIRQLRPQPDTTMRTRINDAQPDIAKLINADTRANGHLTGPNGPLTAYRPWTDALADTGHDLAELATTGNLKRGLREVLAHSVIFHWNRLLNADQQILTANAAVAAMTHQTTT